MVFVLAVLLNRQMKNKALEQWQVDDAKRLKSAWLSAKSENPNFTQEYAADEFGWRSQASVSQYINGRIPLNIEALTKFANLLGVSPASISPRLAERMHVASRDSGQHPCSGVNISPGPELMARVPLISWVNAGEPDTPSDCLDPREAEDWLACPEKHSAGTYALRVQGESMTAPYGISFPSGIHIFVDPEQRGGVCPGEFVIAKIKGADTVTFKQLAIEEGRLYLRPLNPKHNPSFEEFRVLGKVIYAGFAT